MPKTPEVHPPIPCEGTKKGLLLQALIIAGFTSADAVRKRIEETH